MKVLALIAALAAALPAVAAAPLALQFDDRGVTVRNATPGGEVVLFTCAKTARQGVTVSEATPRVLQDSDRDGVVAFEGVVPTASVWIAVDARSGAVGTGAPGEFPIYVRELAPMFRKDATEEINALERQIRRLALLLVRPPQGAWMLRGREGSETDRDGQPNGRLVLAFEDATPVGDSREKAPKHLKAGDVVIAVDLGQLDIFVGEVSK